MTSRAKRPTQVWRLSTKGLRRAATTSWIGLGAVTAIWVWTWTMSVAPGTDSWAYWSVDPQAPYSIDPGGLGAFPYSPVAVLLFSPAKLLPYSTFLGLWTALLIGVALWLIPPMLWAPGLLLMLGDLHAGNVHLLVAASVVVGLRWPAGWAAVLLTKVTPGVGLLWFAVRREWRSMAVALTATLTVVAITLPVLLPLWPDWLAYLLRNGADAPHGAPLELDWPLIPRLIVASLVVVLAARSGRAWLVPLAAILAIPIIWLSAIPAFVFASIRLFRSPPTAGVTAASP